MYKTVFKAIIKANIRGSYHASIRQLI